MRITGLVEWAVLTLTLVVLMIPSGVGAKTWLPSNFITADFVSPLDLSANGRQINASGHYTCQPVSGAVGTAVRINVVITQTSTGAVATGHTDVSCTGTNKTWTAHVVAGGPAHFRLGAAEGCGEAIQPGNPTPLFEWCRGGGVTLVAAS